MPDILHRIGIRNTSIEMVYQALTTHVGLSGWWTSDTLGEGGLLGQLIQFRFGDQGIVVKVIELAAPSMVIWEVIDGPSEWYGTKISFELYQSEDFIILLFKHMDWKEPVEFMHHCSTKWAIFLMSLKKLVETGVGAPHPNDTKIDNWN